MGAKILAVATMTASTSTNDTNNYDALCSCQDNQCHCKKNQIWQTSKLRPTNWQKWPLVKKVLIYGAISGLVLWLLVYLILHFYYERQQDK